MIRYLSTLWRTLFRRDRLDQDLDDELRAYVELVAKEKARSGMAPEEALLEARRELGGIEPVKESIRDVQNGNSFDILIQDLRFALRGLRKNPAFSVVALVTLALGIGANTTIFTIVNSVLLNPLPYSNPDRIFMLWETHLTGSTLGTVAPANFFDWREQNTSFDKVAALDSYPDFILNGSGEPRRLSGAAVSRDFFSLLGVPMALGRDFLPEEDQPGHEHVAILSYSTWASEFGSNPSIIGHAITLNNSSYIVIGVLPRDFSLVRSASDFQARNRFDLWTPLALPSPPPPWQRATHSLSVFARLKPGVTLQQSQTDLNRIAANLERLYPAEETGIGIAAVPLATYVLANVRTALITMLAAVGMVFLIACVNIANLLLTRSAARRKEFALRLALGASQHRIARQLLTESLVLALSGGVLGSFIAFVFLPVLVRHLPSDLPRASEIAVDGRVLAFTFVVSLLTGILFGLVPLFQSRQVASSESLKQGGRSIAPSHSRLRSVLIVGQVAIAMILLTGAGLMAKSFWTLLRVSPGFQTGHILTARLSLPPRYTNGYKYGMGQHRAISAFQRDVLLRVSGIPGVQSAAFTAYLPLSGVDNSRSFDIEGEPPKPAGTYDSTKYRPVSAGYFETIGIPIQRGRSFAATDVEDSPLVVAIDSSMARAFWGEQNPIGQRVRFDNGPWRTIVGVVGDVHHEALGAPPEPEMYIPFGQVPNVEARPTIVLHTSVSPVAVTAALRKAVAEVDPNVPIDQVETMEQLVSTSVGQPRFRTAVLLTFAFLALFVASIGLYGVMSYFVTQRTREFGIRMAVGASREALLKVVLGEAAKLVVTGILLGLAGGALFARLIATLLFGVAPLDIPTLASVSVVLAIVAAVASYIPAQRAANADPMESLRCE